MMAVVTECVVMVDEVMASAAIGMTEGIAKIAATTDRL